MKPLGAWGGAEVPRWWPRVHFYTARATAAGHGHPGAGPESQGQGPRVGGATGTACSHLAGVDGPLQVARADHGRRDQVVIDILAVTARRLDEGHHDGVQLVRGFP